MRAHQSNSHKNKGWEAFTRETLHIINKYCKNVVYLLWGRNAQATAELVNAEDNLIIKEVHPSPMAGTRFLDTKCFSECNEYLAENGKEMIDWNV